MTTSHSEMAATQADAQAGTTAQRRDYHRPHLQEYGNLRGLTLGGSLGASDSGNNMMEVIFFTVEGYEDLP